MEAGHTAVVVDGKKLAIRRRRLGCRVLTKVEGLRCDRGREKNRSVRLGEYSRSGRLRWKALE